MKYTFKIGDKVKCIGTQPYSKFTKGNIYTVMQHYKDIDAFWALDDTGYRDAIQSNQFVLAGTPFQIALRNIAQNV